MEENKEKFILIPKNLLDSSLSNEALVVYAAIYQQSFTSYKQNELFISCAQIEMILFEKPGSEKERRVILNALNELVKNKYINIIQKYRHDSWYCDVSKITSIDKNKFYISIYENELTKIMKIKELKYKIFRYLLTLYGCFETSKKCPEKYKFKICSMPINYLSLISGLSIVTINKYHKTLQDNKVIYVSRRRTFRSPGEGLTGYLVKWECNVYSRYEDKELCEEYAKLNGSTTENDQKKRELDESRRYLQLYNSMIAGKEYDLELISEIFNAVKDWNKRKIEKYEEDISNGKKVQEPKLKDLSIFDKYGLK